MADRQGAATVEATGLGIVRTCASCGVKNRVPAEHLASSGRWGSCKADLPPLVFEDAGDQGLVEPERIALPAPATSLAAGRFDADVFVDLLAVCGDRLVVVFGRDRRLTFSDRAETVVPPEVREFPLDADTLELLAKRRIDLDPDGPAQRDAQGSTFVVDSSGDLADASPGDGA